MKVIQLNARKWTLFAALRDFVAREQPDILLLQEDGEGVMCDDGSMKYGHRENLCRLHTSYQSVFAPKYGVRSDTAHIDEQGITILSKYPIIAHQIHYVPELGLYRIRDVDGLGLDIDASIPGNKYKMYHLYQSNPSCVLQVTIDVEGVMVEVMTAHFTVSKDCKEIEQMQRHAELLVSLIKKEKIDRPIMVGGDFNITPDLISVGLLRKHLTLINDTGENTLNPRIHPGFKNNIGPEGYQVDHLLCRGFEIEKWKVLPEDVSDHLPVCAHLTFT